MASLSRMIKSTRRLGSLNFLAFLVFLGMLVMTMVTLLQGNKRTMKAQQRHVDANPARSARSAIRPLLPDAVKPKTVNEDVAKLHLTVRDRCESLGLGPGVKSGVRSWRMKRFPFFPMSPIISTKHRPNLFYCPVAKGASTYLTRYMVAVDRPGPMVSPFSIATNDAERSKLESLGSLKTSSQKTDFAQDSFRFLFTRNPWWRIFSAYMDKLYSPNPYYWHGWGKAAVRQNRLSASAHPCGTGVSFRHFVKLVLSPVYRNDLHFAPMLAMCRVCDVAWDMVGQVESFRDSVALLSSRINVSAAYQHSAVYTADAANDVILDSATDALSAWRKDITRCVSLYDAGRIIWRRLQIRGIIYSDASFPFSSHTMASMTASRFQRACKQAASKATDKARLKQQKADAFREAYATVDLKDLEKLHEVFSEDFYLFGYNPKPPSIFGSDERSTEGRILDWKQDWS